MGERGKVVEVDRGGRYVGACWFVFAFGFAWCAGRTGGVQNSALGYLCHEI